MQDHRWGHIHEGVLRCNLALRGDVKNGLSDAAQLSGIYAYEKSSVCTAYRQKMQLCLIGKATSSASQQVPSLLCTTPRPPCTTE